MRTQKAFIYIFKSPNILPIPGYDQYSIVAFNLDQAKQILIENVKNYEKFYFDRVDFLPIENEQ